MDLLARLIRRLIGKATPRYAKGGPITGPRPNDDSMPVLLSGCTYGFNMDPSANVAAALRYLNTHRSNHLP